MRLSLTARLTGAFTLVALVAAAAGVFQMFALKQVDTQYRDIIENIDQVSADTLQLESLINQKSASLWGYYIFSATEQRNQFEIAQHDMELVFKRLDAVTDPAAQTLVKNLANANQQLDKVAQLAFVNLASGERDKALVVLQTDGSTLVANMTPMTMQLRAKIGEAAAAQKKSAADAAYRARIVGYGGASIALAVAIIFGIILALGITRPIRQAAGAARQLAEGDLTFQLKALKGTDERADLINGVNRAVQSLRQLLEGVEQSTSAVLAATESLATSAEQAAGGVSGAALVAHEVAQGATEQGAAVDEMRRTMEELRQTIHQIAEGAGQTSAEVTEASELLAEMVAAIDGMAASAGQVAAGSTRAAATARDGAQVVTRAAEGMGRVQAAVGESAQSIKEMEQLSSKVGDITRVITEIAANTSLLSLNAAIEAARAGEQGRGFAVVADAVRQLAEQSAESAKEIAALVGSIQACTAQAAKAMARGMTEVESGVTLTGDAGKALQGIVKMAEEAAREVSTIAEAAQAVRSNASSVVKAFDSVAAVTEESTAATEEMAAGANQVSASTERVAEISQQNNGAAESVSAAVAELNASTEQVAAAAQQLGQVAGELKSQISRFKL
jgi:methyl-accepting chemotaxis protein